MKLQEWTSTVSDELKRAGFEVLDYRGFPLVKPDVSTPISAIPLLDFQPSVPCDRSIFAEGMLFLPPGITVRGARS
jgi:hypothetical protein